MVDPNVAVSENARCKTPRIGSPLSRAEEMSMEAQSLLERIAQESDRAAQEARALRRKLAAETALLRRAA